jgi:hypothetical protein
MQAGPDAPRGKLNVQLDILVPRTPCSKMKMKERSRPPGKAKKD